MHSLGLSSTHPSWFATRSIGQSCENRPILLHFTSRFAAEPGGTLLIGGMHGDERATVLLLLSFMDHLRPGEQSPLPPRLGILPLINPDGYLRNTRANARGVDLNRNFETGWSAASEEPPGAFPLSEPESRALRDCIVTQRPERIVTLHWALGELDADGPQSTSLAEAMWNALTPQQRIPYRLRLSDSRQVSPSTPCPGSLGQWCGEGLRYPDGTAPAIVTLELPHAPHLPRPLSLPEDHLEQLHRAWKRDARAYLKAVEGPVHAMLRAAYGV
jgi:hypothetical protein